jgi:hypothetical protein
MTTTLKYLNDSQLETFDTEYMNEPRWNIFKKGIDQDFPEGDFSFLDVGGGNGKFADLLLDNYPNSQGTVLDNSQLLLSRNHSHPRKTLISASVDELSKQAEKATYDLICFNWLLHHLVGDSYAQSIENISTTLRQATQMLSPRGRISIFENIYDGIIFDRLPSRLIFELTSSKSLATLTRKMGANTAGTGVCFLSQKKWSSTTQNQSLVILSYTDDPTPWPIPLRNRVILHLGYIRVGHFWLKASSKH